MPVAGCVLSPALALFFCMSVYYSYVIVFFAGLIVHLGWVVVGSNKFRVSDSDPLPFA